MIANLSSQKIEELLNSQVFGHIGCFDGKLVYVVPISYAYENGYVYCHSFEGRKINVMRKNSDVCFQVDRLINMSNWESVIGWGVFEEITDKTAIRDALRVLLKRKLPALSSVTTHLGKTWPFSSNGELNEIPGIVFRIYLKEKSGRFEMESVPLTSYI